MRTPTESKSCWVKSWRTRRRWLIRLDRLVLLFPELMGGMIIFVRKYQLCGDSLLHSGFCFLRKALRVLKEEWNRLHHLDVSTKESPAALLFCSIESPFFSYTDFYLLLFVAEERVRDRHYQHLPHHKHYVATSPSEEKSFFADDVDDDDRINSIEATRWEKIFALLENQWVLLWLWRDLRKKILLAWEFRFNLFFSIEASSGRRSVILEEYSEIKLASWYFIRGEI